MTAIHGKFSYFNSSHESLSSYSKRLGYYFAANEVQDEDRKKAILLTVRGPSTFQLQKSLLWPGTPADKSYSKLVEVLSKHFNPAPSVIMQRFKFNTLTRDYSNINVCHLVFLQHLVFFSDLWKVFCVIFLMFVYILMTLSSQAKQKQIIYVTLN